MQRLDEIVVQHLGRERRVTLLVGDMSQLPQGEAVDLLVVSAFPNGYRNEF